MVKFTTDIELKIAHTVSSIYNRSAGPSYSVPGIAKAQAALGAQVDIHSGGGEAEHSSGKLTDIRHDRGFNRLPLIRKLGVSRSMRVGLETGGYDIVHTHGLWMRPNIYRIEDSPFVISPRGMLSSVALGYSSHKKKLVGFLGQNAALRAANLFHATAESEFADIRAYGLDQPVAIIPNGIELPTLQSTGITARKRRRLISIGRIHPKKGLDILLDAWAEVEDLFPSWDLEIIGPDEIGHRAQLELQMASLGVRRARVMEPVYGAAKVEAMSTADLFVLPSRSENFAMTVAESLAASVPVIATRGTPWAGLNTHRCGWWVKQDKIDLAGALTQAMRLSSAELALMGERGRNWVELDFSWERIAKMSLEAYLWLLGRGDRPSFIHVN